MRVYIEKSVHGAHSGVLGERLEHHLVKGTGMLADRSVKGAACNRSQETILKSFWGGQEEADRHTDTGFQGHFCSLNPAPDCICGLRVFCIRNLGSKQMHLFSASLQQLGLSIP